MGGRNAARVRPRGFSVRRADLDDAEAVAGLVSASAAAEGMQSLVTPAELRIEWERSCRYVVIGADATVVGYAALSGRNAEGCVQPDHRGRGIGDYLVRLLETVYREPLSSTGAGHGTLRHWVLGDDRAAHRLLTGAGYGLSRTDLQMIIDLGDAPPQPAWPWSVTVRPFVPTEDERVVYRAYKEFVFCAAVCL